MAFKLANRAFVLTSTTGTGSISLGSVVAGYQSFSAAGITDGDTVRYTIEDGTSWEIGTGTLSNSVGTMARSVIDSSGGGSALTLSGNAKVFLTAAAGDILVEVVEDTSPQLGGNLDVQANEITTSTSNGNVKITPNGSGVVEVKGANGNDGTLQLNCSANSHGVKIKSPPHSAGATYTLTLPNDDGSSGQSLTSDGSGNLSFTTITSNATHTGEVTGSGALTIADNAVTTAKIENNAVTQAKIAGEAINEARLQVSNAPSNGYFLSAQSGNTGGLTWAEAASGADLYAANDSSGGTDPSATGTNSIAIGEGAVSTGEEAIALGKARAAGLRNLSAMIGDNTTSYGAGGNGGSYNFAFGQQAKAASTNSIAMGQYASTGNHSNAIAIGSYSNVGNYNGLALGFSASAVAESAGVGRSAAASGEKSLALGWYSTSSAESSVAIGTQAKSTIIGKFAYASGRFATDGDAQGGQYILRADTTDATATALTTNNTTAGSNDQIVAATDTCITFHGTVVAMQNGAQAHAGWEIKGMLVNDGGTTTLALGNVSDMAATNASSWAVALSADNTNNALKIQVTGEASHNIRWVANVQTSEVTYA